MPYLRLYSRDIQIEQKRAIAQKLIDITMRTLRLRPDERNRITVQFIPPPEMTADDGYQSAIPTNADFMLEVMAHHLTEAKKKAFGDEVATKLAQLLPTKAKGRIARLLGIKADPARQVALQFEELSPAMSDPFVTESERRAA